MSIRLSCFLLCITIIMLENAIARLQGGLFIFSHMKQLRYVFFIYLTIIVQKQPQLYILFTDSGSGRHSAEEVLLFTAVVIIPASCGRVIRVWRLHTVLVTVMIVRLSGLPVLKVEVRAVRPDELALGAHVVQSDPHRDVPAQLHGERVLHG